MEPGAEVASDLFLRSVFKFCYPKYNLYHRVAYSDMHGVSACSAAHGFLDNVEQLLSSGQVRAVLAIDITREEFTTQVIIIS